MKQHTAQTHCRLMTKRGCFETSGQLMIPLDAPDIVRMVSLHDTLTINPKCSHWVVAN